MWHVYEYLKRYEGEATLRQVFDAFPDMKKEDVLQGVEQFCLSIPDMTHLRNNNPMILIEMIESRRKLGA